MHYRDNIGLHAGAGPDKPGLKWINVTGLGIAFAISGNFSGWNFGLAIGGWGGMLIASLIMACFYFCLAQCVAELAAAHPEAQGMDSYAGYGLGPAASFVAGMSVATAVGMATGIGCTFMEAYSQSVLGIGGWPMKLALIAFLVAVQLRGAREAVGLATAGGFFSVAVLLIFCAVMLPHFSVSDLFSKKDGVVTLLPHGISGVLECIPYALFMFFGVEQAANAAGEMREPGRNLPKALFAAVGAVLLIGLGVLVLATGGGGVERVAAADGNPLYVAMTAKPVTGGYAWLGTIVGIGSIVSLLATVFSMTYTASRQFYSLARAGFLPASLARSNAKGAPTSALYLVGLLGVVGATIDANTGLVCFIFSLSICSMLVLASFVRTRVTRPDLNRPYRAVGGCASATLAIVLLVMVLFACVRLQPKALVYVALGYSALALYYFWLARGDPLQEKSPDIAGAD